MKISGDGHDKLIAAIGTIPNDIQFIFLTGAQVEDAEFRVVPFEFDGDGRAATVKCIHQEWFQRYDSIIGETP